MPEAILFLVSVCVLNFGFTSYDKFESAEKINDFKWIPHTYTIHIQSVEVEYSSMLLATAPLFIAYICFVAELAHSFPTIPYIPQ